MNNSQLSEEHQQQWEAFDVFHAQELDELIKREIDTRKEFGMVDEHLPFNERDKILRDRKAFIDKWGPKSSEAAMLRSLQQEQTKEQETDAMLKDMYQQEKADDDLKQEISHALEEKDAVTSYYELKDQPVPHATQQGFAKRFLELSDRYEGRAVQQRRTLDEHDLEHGQESWGDLIKQQEIIRMHYGRAEYIPEASVEQMRKEVNGHNEEVHMHRLLNEDRLQASFEAEAERMIDQEVRWEERQIAIWEEQQIAAYEQKEEAKASKDEDTVQKREEFKEQLKAVQKRSPQLSQQPKPR